jgi:hypothetical protein
MHTIFWLGNLKGRARQRWETIAMNLSEIGWENMNWIYVAQDRGQWWTLVIMVMSF